MIKIIEKIKKAIISLEEEEMLNVYAIESDNEPLAMGIEHHYVLDGCHLYIVGVWGSDCDCVTIQQNSDTPIEEVADKCVQVLYEIATSFCMPNFKLSLIKE